MWRGRQLLCRHVLQKGWAACRPPRLLPGPIALPVTLPVIGATTSPLMLSPGLGGHAAFEHLRGVPLGLVARLGCSQSILCLVVAAAGGA